MRVNQHYEKYIESCHYTNSIIKVRTYEIIISINTICDEATSGDEKKSTFAYQFAAKKDKRRLCFYLLRNTEQHHADI